jgi:hypothetical protein
MAFCGVLLMSSIVVMSDAAGLFWATLSACMLLRWGRGVSTGSSAGPWLIAAAAALALAVVTRWIFAGLLLPWLAFLALTGVRLMREPRRNPAGSRLTTAALVAAGVFLIILGAQLWLNAHSPAPVLKHAWVVEWSPLNAWRRSFDTPSGHFDYSLPPAIFYAAPLLHPLYLFPVLAACVLLGAWQVRRSAAVLIIGGWALALYLFLIGMPYENGRFPLAYFTPVAVLAAIGVTRVPVPSWPRRLANVSAPTSNGASSASGDWRWRGLLLAVSLALALPFTVRAIYKFHSEVSLQDDAIRYLQSRIPRDATVVSFELSIALQHYTPFAIVDLWAQSPRTLRPLVCGDRTAYVFVEPEKLETQWRSKSPAENFHWLRDRIGFHSLGVQGAWALYRLLPCQP